MTALITAALSYLTPLVVGFASTRIAMRFPVLFGLAKRLFAIRGALKRKPADQHLIERLEAQEKLNADIADKLAAILDAKNANPPD